MGKCAIFQRENGQMLISLLKGPKFLGKWTLTKSDAKRGEGGRENLSIDSMQSMQWMSMDGFPYPKHTLCLV